MGVGAENIYHQDAYSPQAISDKSAGLGTRQRLRFLRRIFPLVVFFIALKLLHHFTPLRAPIGPIRWSSCQGASPLFQCGFLKVPLDYHNLSRGDATLAVARYPAIAPRRLGSIFVNPGGPGASGVQFLVSAGPVLSQMLDGKYDIVRDAAAQLRDMITDTMCIYIGILGSKVCLALGLPLKCTHILLARAQRRWKHTVRLHSR